jgi:hypothetical protein
MPNQKPIGSLLDQNRAGRRGSHWRIHGCGANTGSEASVLEIQVSDFRPPRRRSGLLGCGGTAVAHFTVQPDRLLLPSFLEKEPKMGAQSQTSRNRISRRLLGARHHTTDPEVHFPLDLISFSQLNLALLSTKSLYCPFYRAYGCH